MRLCGAAAAKLTKFTREPTATGVRPVVVIVVPTLLSTLGNCLERAIKSTNVLETVESRYVRAK